MDPALHDWSTNFAIVFMVVSLGAGMVRVIKGPTRADRMLSAQLFGTSGVALLLLLAEGMEMPSLIDAALVLTLLTAVAGTTFARVVWGYAESGGKAVDALK